MAASTFDDLRIRDARLPGGSYIQAIWHRDVMRLSDRGRASEAVGDRWSDLCNDELVRRKGQGEALPSGDAMVAITGVARLDSVPAIALSASRRKLQNPDFLVTGRLGEEVVIVPADAKFSVETAKAKQVSADVASELLTLGEVLTGPFPSLDLAVRPVDGLFLSPDYSLTHYLFEGRGGHRGRVTVDRESFVLLPVAVDHFRSGMAGADLALRLSALDALPIGADASLLAYLYYFRLARACAGCWIDLTGPLLTWKDRPAVDDAAVDAYVAEHLLTHPRSAWDLVLQIDRETDVVRQQRAAVDAATSLPMSSAELRDRVSAMSERLGKTPPSNSKVRRMAGSWFRGELRETFGPLLPPVDGFEAVLRRLQAVSRSRRDDLLLKIDDIVVETSTDDVIDEQLA